MSAVDRVKALCKERKVPVSRLERECGFANGYIGQLKKGSLPNDRLQKIADYFGVSLEYLTTGHETDSEPYYLDDEAREMAQFLFENPEYRVLFDASRKVKKEDLDLVKDLLDRFRQD